MFARHADRRSADTRLYRLNSFLTSGRRWVLMTSRGSSQARRQTSSGRRSIGRRSLGGLANRYFLQVVISRLDLSTHESFKRPLICINPRFFPSLA